MTFSEYLNLKKFVKLDRLYLCLQRFDKLWNMKHMQSPETEMSMWCKKFSKAALYSKTFQDKTCQTVAGIGMISQFHEIFFNLIFGVKKPKINKRSCVWPLGVSMWGKKCSTAALSSKTIRDKSSGANCQATKFAGISCFKLCTSSSANTSIWILPRMFRFWIS